MLVCLGIKNKHFIIPGDFSSLLYILEELAVCVCVHSFLSISFYFDLHKMFIVSRSSLHNNRFETKEKTMFLLYVIWLCTFITPTTYYHSPHL